MMTDAAATHEAIAGFVEKLNGFVAALEPQERQWLAGLLAHGEVAHEVHGYTVKPPLILTLAAPGSMPGTTVQADAAGLPFLRFRFDTVFTTKIDWSSSGDDRPER
jgi:hypothetical protein